MSSVIEFWLICVLSLDEVVENMSMGPYCVLFLQDSFACLLSDAGLPLTFGWLNWTPHLLQMHLGWPVIRLTPSWNDCQKSAGSRPDSKVQWNFSSTCMVSSIGKEDIHFWGTFLHEKGGIHLAFQPKGCPPWLFRSHLYLPLILIPCHDRVPRTLLWMEFVRLIHLL